MLIDEIKKQNLIAMKEKNQNLRSIYSIIINKYMQLEIESRTNNHEANDEDLIKIIQKTIKELSDEAENYKKVNNLAQYQLIIDQQTALEKYLPQMLSESEIKDIINMLEDKSIPSVMKHFKTNYNAVADMKLVNEVLRKIQ